MGKLYLHYIEGSNIYICKTCNVHLTSYNELISKAFRGRHGKAYLFNIVFNIDLGKLEEKNLMTGIHIVCDIYCKGCQNVLGWKYDTATDEDQKYKEGKFILEKAHLKKMYWQP